MNFRYMIATTAFALSGIAASPSFAGTLSAATILSDFNGVIYGNASTPSDVEGALVVGGSFSGATIYNNPTANQTQPPGFGALTVFGSTSGNPININNGGSAYVGGSHGAKVNFNGGGGYISAPPVTLSSIETTLNTLSSSLSSLAANSSLPAPNNNEVISAKPNASGLAVFNVTAADLAAIPSYNFSLNGAKTVIVNVSGSSVSFNANDESGTTGANNIIWNFYQATSVNLGTQIAGTILAPKANVTNGNQIDGDLIAASWTGSGELHDYAFDGVLSPVPLPAALPLFGAALLGLGGLGFRKRAGKSV